MSVLLLLFSLLSSSLAQSAENFMIEEMAMCKDVPNQLVKFYLTPKDFKPGFQTADINITSPKSIGENITLHCTGYMEVRHEWLELLNFKQDFCYIFKTFVGQLFYDLETAAAIIPGTCPIAKGTYHAVNFVFDFHKLKLQALPFGRMKYRLESHHRVTKTMDSCIVVIISNYKK